MQWHQKIEISTEALTSPYMKPPSLESRGLRDALDI